MFCNCEFHRRSFFKIGAGLAAAAGLMRSGIARAQGTPAVSSIGSGLPARGEFVVRGGHVLTMDSALGDLATGDVHVRDGAIVSVGANLAAPGAQVIDGRDTIVMPGF